MNTTSEKNKLIAKNTIFLYIRMFLMMGVFLYTSRVVLQTLGVSDFGVYNVVAGIVVLFSFANGAMTIASQRYISFSLGRGNEHEVGRVFSMSLTSHFVIAFLVLIISETIGLWILGKMNFPADRLNAVGWIYQIAVVTCCLQILRVPYNASIIAYERMSFYAKISIVEALLKLLVAYSLIVYKGDKLIFYSTLLLIVTLLVNLVYKLYCNDQFVITKYVFFWDAKMFKEFVNFLGWNLFGTLAHVSAQQGLNMIINIYCGVLVNAAVGVSTQVMSAIQQFLTNFQTAFNPQIVKSYAANDKEYFMNLVFKSSKFSYFLIFIISLPLLINCHFFLKVWLGEVPEYATNFSELMIIFLLVDGIFGSLWISLLATGKVKYDQIRTGILNLLNLPMAFILLYLGYSPVYVFMGRIFLNILIVCLRMFYLRKLIDLSVRKFIIYVISPIVWVTLFSLPLPLWVNSVLDKQWMSVLLVTSVCVLSSIFSIYFWGLTKVEKSMVINFISQKFLKK